MRPPSTVDTHRNDILLSSFFFLGSNIRTRDSQYSTAGKPRCLVWLLYGKNFCYVKILIYKGRVVKLNRIDRKHTQASALILQIIKLLQPINLLRGLLILDG